jgi:hypothetical protein
MLWVEYKSSGLLDKVTIEAVVLGLSKLLEPTPVAAEDQRVGGFGIFVSDWDARDLGSVHILGVHRGSRRRSYRKRIRRSPPLHIIACLSPRPTSFNSVSYPSRNRDLFLRLSEPYPCGVNEWDKDHCFSRHITGPNPIFDCPIKTRQVLFLIVPLRRE